MSDDLVPMHMALPPWGMVIDSGPQHVHPETACAGESCAIHNPSHHMGDWPIVIRFDYGWPCVERTCPHGVGHPDPDSLAWYANETGKTWPDGHGCDGCCAREVTNDTS